MAMLLSFLLRKSSFIYMAHLQFILRPLTPGKRFLLFLPDSHSAYYDSSISALGQSLPPSLGHSRICCTWSSFWRKRRVGRGGGWWDHPPALATLGKVALGTSVGFLGIGRSVSGKIDRFSLLFGAIATPKERLWG